MTRLFSYHKIITVLKIPVRYKNPPHHWSVLKKKKTSSMKALEHFDDFYKSVYGDSWKNIRSALLSTKHKYVAIINNYSDTERICRELEALGAMNMKLIYDATKKNFQLQEEFCNKGGIEEKIEKTDTDMDKLVAEAQLGKTIYPNRFEDPINVTEKERREDISSFKPVQLQSIETDINIADDRSRIINSSDGVAASQLYEYVPATKLKGMDDFVLESQHYGYYPKGDFSIKIEEEYELSFPDNLKIYTYEEGNDSKFPNPRKGTTKVSDYFVLDGASILPILSLDLKPGDKFLDMCAAPGGKTMLAVQSLLPRVIVANDNSESRINRIDSFLHEFLGNIGNWDKNIFLTQNDARFIEDKDIYNKILVDVPCTTDRHVLHEDDNNIFKSTRLKERLKLPELQSEILANALKIVTIGGTVVYSTCSLSPIQNDGVVQMALKKAYEESNTVHIVKDQSRALMPLKFLYNFGDFGLRYGHIVIPSKSRNWGPMYFCKIIRVE